MVELKSLDECAAALARLRSGHPAAPIITTLIGQLKSWEAGDRTELRRTILGTVKRLESPHLLKE